MFGDINEKNLNELFETILALQDIGESKKFFRDLCTLSELKAISERFQIAKKVYNKESYRSISKETGASTATITRVAHWLYNGAGGYELVLDRIN